MYIYRTTLKPRTYQGVTAPVLIVVCLKTKCLQLLMFMTDGSSCCLITNGSSCLCWLVLCLFTPVLIPNQHLFC